MKQIQVQYGDGFPTNGNREISVQASFGNLIGNFRSVWSNSFDDDDTSEEVDSDEVKPEAKASHKLEAKTTYYQPVSKATSISGSHLSVCPIYYGILSALLTWCS